MFWPPDPAVGQAFCCSASVISLGSVMAVNEISDERRLVFYCTSSLLLQVFVHRLEFFDSVPGNTRQILNHSLLAFNQRWLVLRPLRPVLPLEVVFGLVLRLFAALFAGVSCDMSSHLMQLKFILCAYRLNYARI